MNLRKVLARLFPWKPRRIFQSAIHPKSWQRGKLPNRYSRHCRTFQARWNIRSNIWWIPRVLSTGSQTQKSPAAIFVRVSSRRPNLSIIVANVAKAFVMIVQNKSYQCQAVVGITQWEFAMNAHKRKVPCKRFNEYCPPLSPTGKFLIVYILLQNDRYL